MEEQDYKSPYSPELCDRLVKAATELCSDLRSHTNAEGYYLMSGEYTVCDRDHLEGVEKVLNEIKDLTNS